jgi:pSer/pThr/pTyr-binding forkhead associated (FHA) protein
MAGTSWGTRRFPVRIGRAAASDLQFEEPGVWDQHLQLDLDPACGFVLHADLNAPVQVNGERVQEAILRNGDAIEIGSIKLQFWLGETRQTGLRLREAVTWAAIMGVCFAQIGLLYWLLR